MQVLPSRFAGRENHASRMQVQAVASIASSHIFIYGGGRRQAAVLLAVEWQSSMAGERSHGSIEMQYSIYRGIYSRYIYMSPNIYPRENREVYS